MTPFDFVKAITYDKTDIFSEETQSAYVPFIVNKALSQFQDTIFHSNLMNMAHHVDKKLQFHYYLNSLTKRKRFSAWKKEQKDSDLELVSRFYGYNRQRAREALQILSSGQLDEIRKKMETL